MANGLDFAYMYPGAAWIKQRFSFAMRYLSWPDAKVIDKAELDAYRAAGIDVGLNWEFRAQDQLGGAAAGREHAIEARRQAEALGAWPCPIFFSADWDVQDWELPAVDAYLDAAAAVLGGAHLVGEYGGERVVRHAMETGRAAYGWQTFAWSGWPTRWHPGAQLRQVATINAAATGYSPTGAEYDLNVSLADSFGQVGTIPPGGAPFMAALTDDEQREMLALARKAGETLGWVNGASDRAQKALEWGTPVGGAVPQGWMPTQVAAILSAVTKPMDVDALAKALAAHIPLDVLAAAIAAHVPKADAQAVATAVVTEYAKRLQA